MRSTSAIRFIATPSSLAATIRERVLQSVSRSTRSPSMSCTFRLAGPAGKHRPEVVEVSGPGARTAERVVRNLRNRALQAHFTEFLKDRVEEAGHACGVNPSRITVMEDLCFLRMKAGKSGVTPPHSDIYFLAFRSDCLSNVAKLRFGNREVCAACGVSMLVSVSRAGMTGLRAPQMCRKCGRRRLQLFTAWITLGSLDLRHEPRIQFVPQPLRIDLNDVTPVEAVRGYSTEAIRGCRWVELDDACNAQRTLVPGQGVIFHSHVLHRGIAGKKAAVRLSLDFRFVLSE